MFLEAEEWRASVNVDNIVQTFAYPEAEKVFNYYPRFYVRIADFYHSNRALIIA